MRLNTRPRREAASNLIKLARVVEREIRRPAVALFDEVDIYVRRVLALPDEFGVTPAGASNASPGPVHCVVRHGILPFASLRIPLPLDDAAREDDVLDVEDADVVIV